MEPVVPEFYWFLGRAYLSSGRLDDAEASFRSIHSGSRWELLLEKLGLLELWLEMTPDWGTKAIAGRMTDGHREVLQLIIPLHDVPHRRKAGDQG
jgi:hypothetical protein